MSFVQVLHGERAALDRVRGRYVLVGATAAGIGQALVTPVSGLGHPMAGVELSANILASLTQDATVAPMSHGTSMLLTALLAIVPALVYPWLRPRTAFIAFGALLLLTFAVSFALLHLIHMWFGPAAALAVIAVSYPLWSWRRLDATASALSAERNLARATLHCIGDAVITTDRTGLVAYLNPVAQALTGYALTDACGRPLQDVLPTYDETGERRILPRCSNA